MAGKKAKGKRAKTRSKLKRHIREKTTINELIKPIDVGEIVQININSSIHEGMPHKRLHGITGKVVGFQGKTPIVELKDGNKIKKIIVSPAHLKYIKNIKSGEKDE